MPNCLICGKIYRRCGRTDYYQSRCIGCRYPICEECDKIQPCENELLCHCCIELKDIEEVITNEIKKMLMSD